MHFVVVPGMLVDTDAIRALGTVCSSHVADLSDAAATLASLPGPEATAAFGPVGAAFIAALQEAATVLAKAIAALSFDLGSADSVSGAVADMYADADRRGSRLL